MQMKITGAGEHVAQLATFKNLTVHMPTEKQLTNTNLELIDMLYAHWIMQEKLHHAGKCYTSMLLIRCERTFFN